MKHEEINYCMRRKCKSCKIRATCEHFNKIMQHSLMYRPFENLKAVMQEKRKRK